LTPVNDTLRGIIIFITALITIGIWAPLRSKPERLPSGAVLTETYFGLFSYLTLRTETKEPDFKMEMLPDYKRMAATAATTAILWVAVLASIKKVKPAAETQSDPTEKAKT